MTNTSDKPLFILFNTHQTHYFRRKFPKKEREQFEVIAFDGIVSTSLSQYNIQHHSLEDLISESDRREILTLSTNRLIEKMNSALAHLNRESDPHMVDFFDCVKYQKFLEFLSVIYYRHYLTKLFSLFQPPHIVICTDTSLLTILLSDICEEKGIPLHRHPFPRRYHSIQSVYEALPFITKKKDILFHLRRRIDGRSRSLEKISSQLRDRKNAPDVVLFPPFDSKRTLANALEGFHTLTREPFTIAVPLRKNFQREGLTFIEKDPRILTFDLQNAPLTEQEEKKVHSIEFGSYLFLLFSDIFYSRKNIQDLGIFTSTFGLRAWYHDFISTSHLFEQLFSSLRPSLFMGDNLYDFTTRVGNVIAEQRGIKNYAVTQLHQELFSPPYHSFRGRIFDKYLPHVIAVHQQNTAAHIAQHTRIDNPDHVPHVQIIDRDIPRVDYGETSSKEFVILFTTQQHIHTFHYVNIVARVAQTLSETRGAHGIRLIIKPHPAEYAFLYKLAIKKRCPVARVDTSIGIDEALSMADVLVTSHSFTAIEALGRGKKVILLSFSRRAVEPDILLYRPLELIKNPLVTEVRSADELEAVLREYAVMKK